MEFAKGFNALSTRGIASSEAVFFLINNDETIKKLLVINKEKFESNFEKYQIWKELIYKDYFFFDSFCSKYSLDKVEKVKQIISGYSGLTDISQHTTEDGFKALVNLIKNNKESFNDLPLFQSKEERKFQDRANVFDTFVYLIGREKYTLAFYVAESFPHEMTKYMSSYMKKPDPYKVEDWNTCAKEIFANIKHSSSYSGEFRTLSAFQNGFEEKCMKAKEYVEKMQFTENLNQELPLKKESLKKHKI